MDGMVWPVAVTALLLVWRLVVDFVPMFPLNDLARKKGFSRSRDWKVHYIPLVLAMLLNMSPNRPAVAAGLLIALLYLGAQLLMWWSPYWFGSSDEQADRWERLYGRTHRFLPPVRHHTVPDTSHVITGVLSVAAVALMAMHLAGSSAAGSRSAGTSPDTSSAAASSAAPQALATVETAFTQAGQQPDQVLIGLFQEARGSLDIAINAINHDEIVRAILDARIRGVQVRVITDRTEAGSAAQSAKLKQLYDAGIPVKENARKGMMDLKLSVIDGVTGTTGSFNYTVNASTANEEMLVVVRDPGTVKAWQDQFNNMWSDLQNYRDWKPRK